MTDGKDLMIIDADEVLARASELSTIIDRMRQHGSLREGTDYGVIPNTSKPTLYKSGAERLCRAFNLRPEFTTISAMEDWDKGRFAYTESCTLVHIPTAMVLASGIQGHCNSLEDKYRYRWLWANQVKEQAIDTEGLVKRTTKNGKVQYRLLNDDIYTQVNTLKKMAQKRALVAAVLIATNASDQFTQDMEDIIVQTESEVERSPLRTPRPKRVETREPEKPAQDGEGEVRSVLGIEVLIAHTGNGKPYYILRDAEGNGYTAWTRTPFADAGYISKEEWEGEPGTIIPLNPYIPFLGRYERSPKDSQLYWNVVTDSLRKLTEADVFGDTGVTTAEAIHWVAEIENAIAATVHKLGPSDPPVSNHERRDSEVVF